MSRTGEIDTAWDCVAFDDTILHKRVHVGKLKQKEYMQRGAFPIVDQGQALIAGYSDDEEGVYEGELPVIIFGDHTRVFKFIDFPFICGADGTKVLVPNTEEFNPLFLYFALLHNRLPSRGYNRHYSLLREQKLPHPPKHVQEQIADILVTIQRAKEATEKVRAATREIKKCLMKYLFTYGPVPIDEAERVPLKETEIGLIPESWETTELKQLMVERIRNGAFVKRDKFGTGISFLNVANTYRDISIKLNSLESVECSESDLELYGLRVNDLVFVRSSLKREGVGQCCIIEELPEPAIFDCHLMRVKVNEKSVIPKYLAYFAVSVQGKKALIARSKTTTMTTINQSGLASVVVPIPSLEQQVQIVDVLESVDRKIAAEKKRANSLEVVFSSLLHLMMTGQLRAIDMEG